MKLCPELGLEKNPETVLILELVTELFGSIINTIAISASAIANQILSIIVITGFLRFNILFSLNF